MLRRRDLSEGRRVLAVGISLWGMLFCQLGHAHSLREISGGLSSCMGRLRHLGIDESPKRSTLSYANKHRSWRLYEKLFYEFLSRFRVLTKGKKKFRFKNKLFSLDATVIDFCAGLFDWAKFRQTKGAVKLHLLLDHDGYLPVFARLTEGRVHEVNIARGYVDYDLFRKWTDEDVYFVTRLKGNAGFRVLEDLFLPGQGNIVSDQVIELTGYYSQRKYPYRLRRIGYWDEERKEVLVFLTNNFKFAATTVSRIYRDRWQIEVFFKTIKQNLKIKSFVGTSPNAVLTQIWTALIAILVLKYLKFRSTFGWSLSNLVAMLRYNLFIYRDLWEWINDPYQPPPIIENTEQLSLRFV